ncbi:MAG TPA: alpha/beta fold hydrolase, partial [Mycobacteriales bacterium]|nr:alpha/beta fold hydrolase [Mycobacteriales bacterium]
MLSSLPSARRRLVLVVVAAALAGVLVAVALVLTRGGDRPLVAAPQDRPGPVLLVPGYGGSTPSLEALARRLRAAGKDAQVVHLPGNGTGDLRDQAAVLNAAVHAALKRTRAPSVDIVGYSAGGVVARLWVEDDGGRSFARRVITLGSPHHGSGLAGLAGS